MRAAEDMNWANVCDLQNIGFGVLRLCFRQRPCISCGPLRFSRNCTRSFPPYETICDPS